MKNVVLKIPLTPVKDMLEEALIKLFDSPLNIARTVTLSSGWKSVVAWSAPVIPAVVACFWSPNKEELAA